MTEHPITDLHVGDPAGPHEDLSEAAVSEAAARVLGLTVEGDTPGPGGSSGSGGSGGNQPGNTPGLGAPQVSGGEHDDASPNTDASAAELADAHFINALRDPRTENVAYGAHVQERPTVDAAGQPVPDAGIPRQTLRYAPDKSQYTAAIEGEGDRVDLQHTSFLGAPVAEGERARTYDPVVVVLSGGPEGDVQEAYAYDNQLLARLPDGWFQNDWQDWQDTGGSAGSWQQHAANAFNLPPSESFEGAEQGASRQGADLHQRMQDRVATTVTDEFMANSTWSHRDHELPTELVIGETFGGNTALSDRRVDTVIVGAGPLTRAGRLEEPSYRSGLQYEQQGSPIVSAAALQSAVRARDEAARGPQAPPPPPGADMPSAAPLPEQ